MDEIYWAVFSADKQGIELVDIERLTAEQLLEGHSLDLAATIAVGSGCHYRDRISAIIELKTWHGAICPVLQRCPAGKTGLHVRQDL